MPFRFTWVIPEQLAGMALPGSTASLDDDFASLRKRGITNIVTLTEKPLACHDSVGFRLYHFPVRDMGIPEHRQTEAYCRIVDAAIADGQSTAVHCHAGIGRTGTFLAAYLIWSRGLDAAEAIRAVRQCRVDYVQSRGQELYLRDWAKDIAGCEAR